MGKDTDIARAMTALSHPRRVRLFTALEAAGPKGLVFPELKCVAKLSDTTLRHHLRPMQAAGLIVRRREGRHIRFRLDGQAARRAIDEMSERLARVKPAGRAFAQRPPLN